MEARTAAQQRIRDELLAWDDERPVVDPELVVRLEAELEDGVRQVLAEHPVDERLVVSKSALDRLPCDGWWLERRDGPFRPNAAMVAGTLAHRVIELDQAGRRRHDPVDLADHAWHELSTDTGAYADLVNGLGTIEADTLRDRVVQQLTEHRDTWPLLPAAMHVRSEQRLRVRLAGGRVLLLGAPDLTLGRVRDEHARVLLVDLKTGMRRPEHLQELRFYALMLTLKYRQPPFRWAAYYVAEGGWVHEDLDEEALRSAVRRTVAGVAQAARLTIGGPQRLVPGDWCRFCARAETCPAALSQAPVTLEP